MMRITSDDLDGLTDFVFMMHEDAILAKILLYDDDPDIRGALIQLDDVISELRDLLSDLQSIIPVDIPD